jgi:[ribosomal protein S5]-alanine N-acetyltransferase
MVVSSYLTAREQTGGKMIRGKLVTLRTCRESDMEILYELSADVRDMGDFWPISLASEVKWRKRLMETGLWEEENGWLLITDAGDSILGQIVFFKPSFYQNSFEIGYRIYKPENWGKGYMSEALALMVSYLFDTRQIDRIQATIMPGNTGSRRVLEKCGFRLEGILRKAVFHQGVNQDLQMFAVLREDSARLCGLLGTPAGSTNPQPH